MMSLGTSLANVLIKIPFKDPATTVPQTKPCRRRSSPAPG
jgi:hypothetical protein